MPFVRLVDRRSTDPHLVELTVSQWPYEYIISCKCMPPKGVNGNGREEIARMPMGQLEGTEATAEILRLWRSGTHNPAAPPVTLEHPGYDWVWVE